MPSYCVFKGSAALTARMRDLADLPRSRKFATFRQRVQGAVDRGYREGVLAGTDGRGRPLPPLRSERKGAYAGATGQPLVPYGKNSRFYFAYKSQWTQDGGVWVLVGFIQDDAKTRAPSGKLVSRRWANVKRWWGRKRQIAKFSDIAFYHITGARPNPKRDVTGIRPKTWAEIKQLFNEFTRSL
jgi:hypothetical protein